MIRNLLQDLLKDLRYGSRALARTPGFTLVAVLALALGVGANISIFSLVNALFLKPLPVKDASSLVWLTLRPAESSRVQAFSWPDYVDYRERAGVFEGLIAYDPIPMALSVNGEPERIEGQLVTGDYFSVLGVAPSLGRVFTQAEDRAAGAAPVAVISSALWKRRFGSDPSTPGRVVILNGQAFSVIGVAPEWFTGTELGRPAEIWVPFAMQAQAAPSMTAMMTQRGASWLNVIGRLKPGVTLRQARAACDVIARQIAEENPAQRRGTGAAVSPLSGGVHPSNTGEALPIAALLLAVTATVLMISCFNVANMLLARGAARRREIGVRLALGATRGRLVRQFLAESTLLALLGSAAGLLMAAWVPDVLAAVADLPSDIPLAVSPDARVLAFALGIALLAGLLAGLAPSLSATRRDVAPSLKDEGFAGGGLRRSRLQGLLVIGQVALSLVLLVSAGLFLRSLGKAARIDPGFDTSTTLTVSFDLRTQGYSKERARVFCRDLIERVSALPGVRSATLASLVPMSGRMIGMEAFAPPAGGGEAVAQGVVSTNIVRPGYFRTLGIPLLRGRDFTAQDLDGAGGVIIVNETLARRFFSDAEPIGQRLSFDGPNGPWQEIVGIARDSRYDELTEDPRSFVYLPQMQNEDLMPELALIASAGGDPSRLLPAVQREVRAMDPALPVFDTGTLAAMLRQRNDKQQWISHLLTLFGSLALALAAMGLYGVMAYSVSLRTHEIGVRMALGATARDVTRLFVREGVRLSLVGIAAGGALALALTQALSSMLFGVTPTDFLTFAGVAALLAAVAVAASWLPARRAARIDPMLALRHE